MPIWRLRPWTSNLVDANSSKTKCERCDGFARFGGGTSWPVMNHPSPMWDRFLFWYHSEVQKRGPFLQFDMVNTGVYLSLNTKKMIIMFIYFYGIRKWLLVEAAGWWQGHLFRGVVAFDNAGGSFMPTGEAPNRSCGRSMSRFTFWVKSWVVYQKGFPTVSPVYLILLTILPCIVKVF